MALPEILTRLRSRKKPVRDTATPTVAAISATSAPANLTDVIKKFNANTEDTALALETLKTDLDAKTATTITLSPTAINLPAESTASVTLHVDNLNLLPDGTVFNPPEPPTPVTITTLADTDKVQVLQNNTNSLISFADLKALLGANSSNSGTQKQYLTARYWTGFYDKENPQASYNVTNKGNVDLIFPLALTIKLNWIKIYHCAQRHPVVADLREPVKTLCDAAPFTSQTTMLDFREVKLIVIVPENPIYNLADFTGGRYPQIILQDMVLPTDPFISANGYVNQGLPIGSPFPYYIAAEYEILA